MTKRQLRAFFRISWYYRAWLIAYGLRVQSFYEVPKESKEQSPLVWGPKTTILWVIKERSLLGPGLRAASTHKALPAICHWKTSYSPRNINTESRPHSAPGWIFIREIRLGGLGMAKQPMGGGGYCLSNTGDFWNNPRIDFGKFYLPPCGYLTSPQGLPLDDRKQDIKISGLA